VKIVGYLISSRRGNSLVLPDQSRAEAIAAANYGRAEAVVTLAEHDAVVAALVAAHDAGLARLRDQLGLAVHPRATIVRTNEKSPQTP